MNRKIFNVKQIEDLTGLIFEKLEKDTKEIYFHNAAVNVDGSILKLPKKYGYFFILQFAEDSTIEVLEFRPENINQNIKNQKNRLKFLLWMGQLLQEKLDDKELFFENLDYFLTLEEDEKKHEGGYY